MRRSARIVRRVVTRKRIIALVFIIVAAYSAYHFWNLPDSDYGHYVFNFETGYVGNRTVQFPNLPRVNYSVYAFFQTDGGFFPWNNINYTVYVSTVNKTPYVGLTRWYCCLGFTGASYTNDTDNHLVLVTQGYYKGYYVAKGTMTFFPDANAYPYLFPTPAYAQNIPPRAITLQELPKIQDGPPAFTVGTGGDTLALNFDEFVAKLTFVGLSISIVFFEPLVQKLLDFRDETEE